MSSCSRLISNIILFFAIISTLGEVVLIPAQDVGFSNQRFRVVTRELAPFIFFDPTAQGNDRFSGLLVQLLNQILLIAGHNNSMEIYMVPDGLLGDVSDNGTVTGCVAEAFYGHADIILATLTESPSRIRAIDFGVPWFQASLSILTLADQSASPDPFAFFDPFTPRLWILFCCSGLICAISIWLIDRCSPFGHHNQFRHSEEQERYAMSFATVLYHSMIILFSTGVISARNWGVRIFAIAFYFVAIIISTSYLANSIAALSSSAPRYSIGSINDFVASDLHFCVESQSAIQSFFLNSPDPLYHQASTLMVLKQNQAECLDALRSGEVFGYIIDFALLAYIANNLPCDTRTTGPPFAFSYYGLPTAKNFSFRFELSYFTSFLVESGVVADYIAQWNSSAGCDYIRSLNQKRERISVDIPQLAGLWYILVIAAACSVVLVGVEWWLWSNREIRWMQPLRTFFGDRQKANARRVHSGRDLNN